MEVLRPYELNYSDLLLVSSNHVSSSPQDLQISKAIMQALGPTGPGLLSVTGVPNAAHLRRTLLPLARKLALMDPHQRSLILKDQRLGSDVPLKNPHRNVSSFSMQIKYSSKNQVTQVKSGHESVSGFDKHNDGFRELGICMMELGVRLARVCDRAIGGGQELEMILMESGTAKARLIHYHSVLEKAIPAGEGGSRKGLSMKRVRIGGDCSDMWQQWHYDYGIFTVLTAPLFVLGTNADASDERERECAYPNGHTCLQVFDPSKNNVFIVEASPDSFIVQVGESADIISRGKPAWNKTFSTEGYPMSQISRTSKEIKHDDESEERSRLTDEIHKIVPHLSMRLKNGMTFADFSRETTKQYYGGTGLQSNR